MNAEGDEINSGKTETIIELFTRCITLGLLVQASNAFSKVHESSSFIDFGFKPAGTPPVEDLPLAI